MQETGTKTNHMMIEAQEGQKPVPGLLSCSIIHAHSRMGHGVSLQILLWTLLPGQLTSHTQLLVRVWVPPLQLALQSLHAPHSLQCPMVDDPVPHGN